MLINTSIDKSVLRFQGINAQRLDKDDIQAGDNGWYKVQSQTTHGDYHSVNTHIGFCTCPKERDGSPCLHQAAVVVQYSRFASVQLPPILI